MPSEYANDLMARVGLDTTEWKKGITDLNSGIKHIETGFQASAALMDDWGNSSDGLKKRIETLNDKLALQKQKLDILKKAYDEEVAANGEGSKAAEELAKKMYSVKNEIDRTKTSVDLYSKKINDMSVISDKTAQKIDTLANKTRTLSTVATAGLAALGAGLIKAGQDADELNTLAKQTGLTTEEIQKFRYASDLIDVELEDMTGALRKMTRNMISTSTEVQSAWETLGVSTTDATGKARDATTVFYEVLAALSKVGNETERDQLAMLIFGKSANELAGIVDDGGTALRKLGDEAENLGLVMSQDAVDGANEFNDVIDKLKANVTATLGKAFSENAAKLTETAEDVAGALVKVVNAVADAPPWMIKTALAITGLSAVLSPLLTVSSNTVSAMVKLTTALTKTATSAPGAAKGIKGIATAIKTANPYIVAVAAALALVGLEINRTIKEAEERINSHYDDLLEKSTKIHDNEIDNLSEVKKKYDNYLSSETAKINSFFDNKIKHLDEDLKAQKKAIETEKSLLEEAHKKRISQLEEERKLKLEIINIQEENEISNIQKQIDALDALTEAEEKAKKERENQEKLESLQQAINSAKTYAEKVDAEKEYNAFLQELEEEKVRNAREAQKQELQNQIEKIKQESENKRNQINTEYEQTKQLAEDKYNLEKESLDLRLEALDTYIEDETAKLEAARNSKLNILNKETEDYIKELQERIDKEKKMKQDAEDKIEADRLAEINDVHTVKGFLIEFANGYNFPGNASGTDFWRGGPTRINEEGGEIINLPRGTQIIPHDVSMEMARASGQSSVTNNSNTTNNSYNYGAQQQVTVLQVGDRTVAKIIEPAVSVKMSNDIYGRRRSGGAR